MAKNIILGVLGASILMGVAAPAYAQNNGNRGAREKAPEAYSQNVGREDRKAQRNQRGQKFNNNRRGVRSMTFNTRFRAKILLTEKIVRSRRGPKKVCTISVRGPQARLVPKKRLRKVARNNCSRRAKVQVNSYRVRR